jgi:hypothetical protein
MKYWQIAAVIAFAVFADAQVTGVPCITGCSDSLSSYDYSGTPYVYVAGFYAEADGGEGEFHLEVCSVDGGSCVQGYGSSTWKRLNLDGSVEQFGAVPATSGDNSANNSYAPFFYAIQAAQAAGLGTVYVRGNQNGSRYYLDGGGTNPALAIPQGMKLQCLSAPAGQSEALIEGNWQPTGYYGAIPFTLIVPSSQTILVGQAGQFQGCEIQQAGLDTPPSNPTYRTLENGAGGYGDTGGVASFAGTAITLGNGTSGTGDNAEVRDTTIIGFNTGIYSQGNSDIKLTNVIDDSTRCFDIQKEDQGVATVSGLYCYPEMTRQVTSGFVNIADNGSGIYRVTLCILVACGGTGTYACTANQNCPMTGDTAWITDPAGAESSEGRWSLSCDGTSSTPTTYCDLVGSQSGSLSGTGTFAMGVT